MEGVGVSDGGVEGRRGSVCGCVRGVGGGAVNVTVQVWSDVAPLGKEGSTREQVCG